jgi:hypothetical protein
MSKLYLFNGSQYVGYDTKQKAVAPGYPQPIAGNWSGLPTTGVDAALNWGDGVSYFFVGSDYYRYNNKLDLVDAGYPKPIAGNWNGLTLDRVDACFRNSKGKVYFFRGDRYWRFDVAADLVDAGYPKPIAGNWSGLFTSDLDGAINYGNGKAYFFKGNEYISYDLPSDRADVGYPKLISTEWTGVFPSGVRAPIILGFAGFDRLQYPGDATMTTLWTTTNLKWCGFYLAPSPSQPYTGWMSKRNSLTAQGWGIAPIYVGEQQTEPTPDRSSHNPSTAKGIIDGDNAVDLAIAADFPVGSTIYLDIETGGPIANNLKDYYLSWVSQVITRGFQPGVYCSFLLARQFLALDSRPVFWAFNLNKFPTGAGKQYKTPFPAPEVNFSDLEFLTLWQLSQGINLDLPSGILNTYDLNSASVGDPSSAT